jgi:hypothetical protein
MSRKVFTAGEVLAASDVNSFLMDQSVMSFAGTAARGSAIPSPVTGMTTYLEDTKDLQIYDGSAYNSALGLNLIKTQTIGSAVSTVTVTSAFSANYDNYKIVISGVTASVEGTGLRMTLNGSTGNTYNFGGNILPWGGSNAFASTASTSSFQIGNTGVLSTTNISIELFNPFVVRLTTMNNSFSVSQSSGAFAGFENNSVSHTAFTFFPASGTLTGGTVSVYGYRKS